MKIDGIECGEIFANDMINDFIKKVDDCYNPKDIEDILNSTNKNIKNFDYWGVAIRRKNTLERHREQLKIFTNGITDIDKQLTELNDCKTLQDVDIFVLEHQRNFDIIESAHFKMSKFIDMKREKIKRELEEVPYLLIGKYMFDTYKINDKKEFDKISDDLLTRLAYTQRNENWGKCMKLYIEILKDKKDKLEKVQVETPYVSINNANKMEKILDSVEITPELLKADKLENLERELREKLSFISCVSDDVRNKKMSITNGFVCLTSKQFPQHLRSPYLQDCIYQHSQIIEGDLPMNIKWLEAFKIFEDFCFRLINDIESYHKKIINDIKNE